MVTKLTRELTKIKHEFLSPYNDCKTIINGFAADMDDKKSLKMLKTFISFNDTSIKPGEYLSLDFGGSNVRISRYEVEKGSCKVLLKDIRTFRLRGDDYDYTTDEYTLSDIFDKVVEKMSEIIEPNKEYLLGHTFSFAINSVSKNCATLVAFSKGFNLREAMGEDVNKCLEEAINRKGLKVKPVAILNDTTATLLSGYDADKRTNMACIIGTGHNMCFINKDGEVINIESGGFNDPVIPLTKYDKSFLEKIPNERHYLMEALIGGKNSAKLITEVMDDLAEKKLVEKLPEITPQMMSKVIEEDLSELSAMQNLALRSVSKILYKRAAYLVACEIFAILNYTGIEKGRHNVVFDGSVYEHTPYFSESLTKILENELGGRVKITHKLARDGSSRGALIACAMQAD